MNIEKESLVALSPDEKAVALKRLTSIYQTAGELHSQIKNNELTVEMKDCLLSLLESYTSEAAKTLKYNAESTQRISERYADIKHANKRIHDLEKLLSDNTEVSGLKELMQNMHMALYEWWKLQGFNLVTDDEFGSYGYKGHFYLDTSQISFLSTRPITESENHKNRLQSMIDEGYEFVKQDRREYVLLDTPNNRQLLTTLVKTKFPSLEITKWENHCLRNHDGFQLRSFECYIRNLTELKELIPKMNQLTPNDEE